METTEREPPEVDRARERVAWHALDAEVVLERLDSSLAGLSADEATRRLAVYGPNRIARATRVHPVRILLHQFTGALVYVLMAALVVSLAIAPAMGLPAAWTSAPSSVGMSTDSAQPLTAWG